VSGTVLKIYTYLIICKLTIKEVNKIVFSKIATDENSKKLEDQLNVKTIVSNMEYKWWTQINGRYQSIETRLERKED
jgi:ethanolamine utilization protein EutQ (cupin superfamily)